MIDTVYRKGRSRRRIDWHESVRAKLMPPTIAAQALRRDVVGMVEDENQLISDQLSVGTFREPRLAPKRRARTWGTHAGRQLSRWALCRIVGT